MLPNECNVVEERGNASDSVTQSRLLVGENFTFNNIGDLAVNEMDCVCVQSGCWLAIHLRFNAGLLEEIVGMSHVQSVVMKRLSVASLNHQ